MSQRRNRTKMWPSKALFLLLFVVALGALLLAWVRIPLNTTSSSAHIGFEFNQGTTPCPPPPPTDSDGLVKRTPGDILIVYDFEGGTSSPVLTLRRWVTSGACDVSSDSAP